MLSLEPNWDAPAGVRAHVTTRAGGASRGAWADFNLAEHVGDDPDAVRVNRARLAAALALPGPPRWLAQIHSGRCVDAARVTTPVAADASFTRVAGVVCAVLTADCLPILVCARDASAVAAIHAGWRGLDAGVIPATIAALELPPARLCAWIGPSIGPEAYAVGSELRDRFVARDRAYVASFERRAGAWHADLRAIARHQLARAGVEAIAVSELCTFRDRRFYSYRRDGVTGRFASLIWFE